MKNVNRSSVLGLFGMLVLIRQLGGEAEKHLQLKRVSDSQAVCLMYI